MAKTWLRSLAPLLLLSCSETPGGPSNAVHAEAAGAQAGSPYRPLEAAAGHRLEAFAPVTPVPEEGSEEAERQSARHCTADRIWCAQLERGASRWSLHIFVRPAADARAASPLYFEPAGQVEGDPHFSIWPSIVREAGGAALIGVLTSRRMGFSGGGAMVTRLSLVRIERDRAGVVDVLEVPVEAGATVRACFSEEDMQRRLEACHDEYDFAAELTIIPPRNGDQPQAGGGGPAARSERPTFLYQTRATTFPGRRARMEDSSEAPPLRRSDLVRWPDPECSFSRTFTYDPATRRYRPDSPLPACDDYLDFDWPGPPPGE